MGTLNKSKAAANKLADFFIRFTSFRQSKEKSCYLTTNKIYFFAVSASSSTIWKH